DLKQTLPRGGLHAVASSISQKERLLRLRVAPTLCPVTVNNDEQAIVLFSDLGSEWSRFRIALHCRIRDSNRSRVPDYPPGELAVDVRQLCLVWSDGHRDVL